MKYWILTAALTALACIAAVVLCIHSRKRLKQQEAEIQQLQIEKDGICRENVELRREIAGLCRDLEEEQLYSDQLNQDLDDQYQLLLDTQERAERAEARRTDAEKEIYAGRMRAEQLQQQLKQSHEEQNNQERLYQDIIRDRDRTISELQDKLHKRRKKKKPEVIDRQITLDDLLGGNNQ